MKTGDHFQKIFHYLARILPLILVGIALAALAGWILHRYILAGFSPFYIPMAPSTALCFILLGSGAFSLGRWPSESSGARVAAATALPVLLFSLLVLAQAAFGFDLGLEEALSRTRGTFGGQPLGRMSPLTALLFLMAGTALISLCASPAARWPARDTAGALAVAVFAGGLVVLTGYLMNVPLLYGGKIVPVAMPTALAFMLMALSLMAILSRSVRDWGGVLPVAFALGTGIFLSLAVFITVEKLEQERIKNGFQEHVKTMISALRRSIDRDLDELDSLGDLYRTVDSVGRQDFRHFTVSALKQHSSIQALEWIPRVPREERGLYEKAARREGFPSFEFRERNWAGEMVAAASREEYSPVFYLEPYQGNESALGFDIASDPARRVVLEKAGNSGMMTITGRIMLVQEKNRQYGVLAFLPVHRRPLLSRATVARQRANLRGFLLGVFRPGEMMEIALKELDHTGINIYLYDMTADGELLYARTETGREGSGWLSFVSSFPTADRMWELRFYATASYLARQQLWQAWSALAAGFLFTAMLGMYMLTSARRTAEVKGALESVADSEARFRAVAQTAVDAIVTINERGIVVFWNKGAENIFGFSREEIIGSSVDRIIPERFQKAHKEGLHRAVSQGEFKITGTTVELIGRRKESAEFPLDLSLANWETRDGRFFTAVIRDITESKQLAEVLRHQSITDGLTEIANRRYFDEIFEQEWRRAVREKTTLALIMGDIDFFKEYNDTYGHQAGDECLRLVASLMNNALRRPGDMAARYGGEEFVMLMSATGLEGAVSLAESVREKIEELRIPHNGSSIKDVVTVSFGVAVMVPGQGDVSSELIFAADQALYEAKREGRNRVRSYGAKPTGIA